MSSNCIPAESQIGTEIVLRTFLFFFFFKLFCDLRLGRVKTVFAENRNKRSCKRMVNDQRIRRLELE